MRAALDTNILAYAEGLGDARRCEQARLLLAALPIDDTLVPAQVLGELSRVLTLKARRPAAEVRDVVLSSEVRHFDGVFRGPGGVKPLSIKDLAVWGSEGV